MAFGITHRIEYKDYSGIDTRIEILLEGYTGAITECVPAEDPLDIEMPDLDSVFAPVAPKGAAIRVIAASSGQFMSLYTLNPLGRPVRIYKGSATVPFWVGYLNTEVYGEDYSRNADYDVALQANDGFNALRRIKYLAPDGSQYSTLDTKWAILQRILTRMALPFEYLYFACEHECAGVTVGAAESLFHKLLADNKNFYDEQAEPMTLRDVLEALLNPYPLQIQWHNGSLYIYDPSMLADANFTAKRFNGSFAYVDTVAINRNFDISAGAVGWESDDQYLDIISGFNRQIIRHSPYPWEGPIEIKDITDENNWTGTPVWTRDGAAGFPYRLSGITAVSGYTLHAAGFNVAKFTGHKETDTGEPEYYFSIAGTTPDAWLAINSSPYRYLTQVKGQSLRFRCKLYCRTKANELDDEEEPLKVAIIMLPIKFRINGNSFHFDATTRMVLWDIDGFINYGPLDIEGSALADKWNDIEVIIPWNFPTGILDVSFGIPTAQDRDSNYLNVYQLKETRIKDIEIDVVDVDSPSDSGLCRNVKDANFEDIEYVGSLNEQFENEGTDVETVLGDGTYVTDRGAIRREDLTYTSGWRKTGETEYYHLGQILLRTYTSQHQESLKQLSGSLEAPVMMSGSGSFSFFSTIQDTTHLGAIKFMCVGGKYNDFSRVLNGKYLEIKADDLTIVIDE